MEKYIRNFGDPNIVGYFVMELLVSGKGFKRNVVLPLGPESSDITFKQLGNLAFDYYNNLDKSKDVYGFSYKIIE